MNSNSWDKILLIVISVVVIGVAGLFISKSMSFSENFVLEKGVPNDEMPPTDERRADIASTYVDSTKEWEAPLRGESPKPLPLFVSIPIVEMKGQLIDMLDPNAPTLREPVTNAWLLQNNLDFLNKGVLSQDPDGDGYTNREEWDGKTEPRNADSHPPYVDKLRMVKREQEVYKLKFAARPDAQRFQIIRMPTSKWPKRENFYVRVGEVSEDKQFKVDSFEEKSAQRNGITVDASVLNITYLPKNTKHQLVRNVEEDMPTYYAELEFLLDKGNTFYVKEGDTFPITRDPGTKYRVTKVNDNSATVVYETADGQSKTVEIKNN